jgi:signal transduction histidine kinase
MVVESLKAGPMRASDGVPSDGRHQGRVIELRAADRPFSGRERADGGVQGSASASTDSARALTVAAGQVGRIRDAARAFAEQHGAVRPDDVALAVHEVCANTALHPDRDGGSGSLELTATCDAGRLTFVIEDHAAEISSSPDSPGLGIGLAIVAQLSDAFELESSAIAGTRLRLVFAAQHDERCAADTGSTDAAAASASVVRDNQRLAARAEAALRETERSRARMAAVAEQERRRIERDLHDGAQQRLIALRIGLTVAQELATVDPARCAARLAELGHQLDEALDELRLLAQGICPPLLVDRGLVDAIASAARRSVVPVELRMSDVGRYAPEIETSVYFCILEALQNVAKHARGVRVEIDGHEPGRLRFEVRDDGTGMTSGELRPGNGITNMRDRIHAIGGEIVVSCTPTGGTLVRGDIPIARNACSPHQDCGQLRTRRAHCPG